jgi:hypothetical protein
MDTQKESHKRAGSEFDVRAITSKSPQIVREKDDDSNSIKMRDDSDSLESDSEGSVKVVKVINMRDDVEENIETSIPSSLANSQMIKNLYDIEEVKGE